MAQSLAAGNDHNSGDPMTIDLPFTQAQYEKWCRDMDSADREVREATGARRDVRARIKGSAGKNGLKAFDLARRERDLPGADRVEIDSYKRQMMQWEGKPLGYQAGFDLTDAPPPARFQLPEKEMKRVDDHGYTTGKAGHPASRNPWNPGTEPFDAWLAAWTRGQGDKVTTEVKRGPGRPKGSGQAKTAAPAPAAAPKRRGRKSKTNGADPAPLGEGAPANEEARRLGRENGLAGNQDNAARWPQGTPGSADYWMGHADGSREREEKGDPLPLAGAASGPLLN